MSPEKTLSNGLFDCCGLAESPDDVLRRAYQPVDAAAWAVVLRFQPDVWPERRTAFLDGTAQAEIARLMPLGGVRVTELERASDVVCRALRAARHPDAPSPS